MISRTIASLTIYGGSLMKNILLGAFGTIGIGVGATAVLLYGGVIDVAADTPHTPAIYQLIEWTRERSIARRVDEIVPPSDLSDADRIRRGAGNYDAMCADCHLAPNAADSEIRKGLYPTPPNLAKPVVTADSIREDARRFWIIKHGLKATGMPAWSKGGMEDSAIWDLTAFLKVLPNLSAEQYRAQVAASDGHSHGGMNAHDGRNEGVTNPKDHHDAELHAHDHSAHKH